MQSVPRDALEALATEIAERLPRPLKEQASRMAAFVMRALGGDVPEVHLPEGDRIIESLKVTLLKEVGATLPDATDGLGAIFNKKFSTFRSDRGKFADGGIETDQLVALAILLVVSSPGVSFYYKDLGEILSKSGRPEMAIHWLEFGRRLYSRGCNSKGEVSQQDRVIYSMFLHDEAHCHADLGNFTQAIDLRLKAHALNANDPDFSAVERWSSESVINEPVQRLQIGGGRLPALMLAVSSVAVVTSQIEGGELASHTSPAHDFPSPLILGDIKQHFTKHVPERLLRVEKYSDIRVYSDYWKTAVTDSAGHLLRRVSSGPAELPILASYTGLGPLYPSLPGVTAIVTFNHNWLEYYHWLIEIAHRIGFVLESGIRFDNLIAPGAHCRSYCQEFLSLTGLDAKSVLGGSEPIAVRASEAIIPSRPQFISSFGIDFLKNIYLGQASSRAKKGRRILISRQKAKDRRISNYDQVHDILAAAGFEVLTFEEMDVRTQARIMSESEIVVAPHGAGLSNVIFCEPGTTIIEFFPPNSPAVFQTLSQICGLNYTAIHAEWSGSNMSIDINYIRAALGSARVS